MARFDWGGLVLSAAIGSRALARLRPRLEDGHVPRELGVALEDPVMDVVRRERAERDARARAVAPQLAAIERGELGEGAAGEGARLGPRLAGDQNRPAADGEAHRVAVELVAKHEPPPPHLTGR